MALSLYFNLTQSQKRGFRRFFDLAGIRLYHLQRKSM